MKILSDFDGVLTDLADEARRVRALFHDVAVAIGGPAVAAAVIGRADARMASAPDLHGWMIDGRLTAFADEDDFVRVNGLGACLDAMAAAGDVEAVQIATGLGARGLADFRALAQDAYTRMTRETAAGRLHPVDPTTGDVLRELAARGHEIVVVSNSGTERILAILREAGLDPSAHDGRNSGPLRVRGDARKFILGSAERTVRRGDRTVDTNRPHYEAILREEQPDVVIGDVLSLDLALPMALAESGVLRTPKLHAVLRRRPYTPAWTLSQMRATPPPRVATFVIDALPQLLAREICP